MSGHACRGNHKCGQIEAVLQKLDLVQKCPYQIFLSYRTGYYQKCTKNLTEHSTYHLVTFKSNIIKWICKHDHHTCHHSSSYTILTILNFHQRSWSWLWTYASKKKNVICYGAYVVKVTVWVSVYKITEESIH
jgi:hypothetical protein